MKTVSRSVWNRSMYHSSMSASCRVQVDREVEEVRDEHRHRLACAAAPGLQDVEPLDDHDVRLPDNLLLAGDDVVGQVRVHGCGHLGHTRLHVREKANELSARRSSPGIPCGARSRALRARAGAAGSRRWSPDPPAGGSASARAAPAGCGTWCSSPPPRCRRRQSRTASAGWPRRGMCWWRRAGAASPRRRDSTAARAAGRWRRPRRATSTR